MAENRTFLQVLAVASISAGLSAASAEGAFASEWEFTLKGVFNGTTSGVGSETIAKADGTGGPTLTANEPFMMTALFNDADVVFGPGINGGYPGFYSYAPKWVTLSIGGQTYGVETYSQNPTTGVTVSLFDKRRHLAAPPLTSPPASFRIRPPTALASSATGLTRRRTSICRLSSTRNGRRANRRPACRSERLPTISVSASRRDLARPAPFPIRAQSAPLAAATTPNTSSERRRPDSAERDRPPTDVGPERMEQL